MITITSDSDELQVVSQVGEGWAGQLGQWARSGGCWVRESSSGQSEGTAGADCLEEEALGKKSGLTAAASRARHKLFIYQARECSLVPARFLTAQFLQ